ncbi:heme ABC exporter ATP-binding protein CcmA [Nannocystaceae bacterium ST9]
MEPTTILPVELRGITCRFGRNAVLRGVDLEVRAGEIVGLLGANGAGKTTLFSILVGLRQPDAGTRSFAGRERVDVDVETRAKLAWLAHHPQIYPLLSARENVELFVELAGRPTGELAVELLGRLGLAHVVDQPVQTFSRGMAQRVALARALALAPELLILDEPFTALDRAGQALLVELLRAEAKRGAAVLLASHDVDILADLVDRAALLEGGVIAARAERAGESSDGFRRRLAALGAAST